MNRTLLALLLLLGAILLGVQNSHTATRAFKAGWATTDTASEIIALTAKARSTGNYDCLHNAGTNYQVPVGKTLYITHISYQMFSASGKFQITYGDNAIDDAVTTPTNNVVVSGEIFGLATGTEYNQDIFIPIPASKYPHFLAITDAGAAHITAILLDN